MSANILQTIKLTSGLTEDEKQDLTTIKKLVRMGRSYAALNADPNIDVEDDSKLFLHTLWATEDVDKAAQELQRFLSSAAATLPTFGGVLTATITVSLEQEVVRDATGQVIQPGTIRVRQLLPSQGYWNISTEQTFEYTGEPVMVPIYRSREDGSPSDNFYSQVVIQHSDGRENSLYDFATAGYPSVPLQPGDTVTVPRQELPSAEPVERLSFFEKLLTAIDLAAEEGPSADIQAFIDAFKSNPVAVLAAISLLIILQLTPLGLIFDSVLGIVFGVKTATSLYKFLKLVDQAVDIEELREAARAFNDFGTNFIETATSLAGTSPLLKYLDNIPNATPATRFVEQAKLSQRILTRVENGTPPVRATLDEAQNLSPAVNRFMQEFGNNPSVVQYLNKAEESSDINKLNPLTEIAERLDHPDNADIADALSNYDEITQSRLLSGIFNYGPKAVDAIKVVDNLLSVNGQIFIHPKKLAEIEHKGDFANLLTIAEELFTVNGNPIALSQTSKGIHNRLISSNGPRLRFEYQLYEEVNDVLRQLTLESNAIFQGIDRSTRARLWDWTRNYSQEPTLFQQASYFALSHMNAANAFDFVSLAEFYAADIPRRTKIVLNQWQTDVDDLVNSGVPIIQAKEQVSMNMFNRKVSGDRQVRGEARKLAILNSAASSDPGRPSIETLNDVSAEYSRMTTAIDGRLGSSQINPNLSFPEIVQQIQDLPQVKFANEPTAAYHALKHYNDLPITKQQGDIFDNYFNAANEAIATAIAVPRFTNFNQFNGGLALFFMGNDVSPNGKKLEAIVGLTAEGNVTLLSYF